MRKTVITPDYVAKVLNAPVVPGQPVVLCHVTAGSMVTRREDGALVITHPEEGTEMALSEKDQKYIENTFMYHPPKEDQPERYNYLRGQAKSLAGTILDCCPESRERSLALTQLEQAIFWANASIARNE